MERSFWSTLRGKLLSRTLVVVLVPVLAIGAVAIGSIQSLSGTADEYVASARTTLRGDVVGSQVADVSEQIAREIAIFLDERVADVQGWSGDFGLIEAATASTEDTSMWDLEGLSIDEIEAQFEDEPRLGNSGVERDLLNAVASSPAFQDIFITDANGFVVDYSSPTPDFVQSDEGWWNAAMTNGIDISAPEFDASSGVFAMNISIRLEDNGQPVGVLKAALDVQVIQVIADRFVGGADALDVTIVDAAGRFLAETSSGHDPTHIMNPIYLATALSSSSPFVLQVFEPNSELQYPDGYWITEDGVGGYADVNDELGSLDVAMQSARQAFDWTIVVEQPADVAFAALVPLEGLAGQVDSTSSKLSLLVILVALFGAVAAAYMTTVFGRRLTSPIARLRNAAVRAAEITLPNVVAQIDALEPNQELPELERISLKTGDEVEDLAESFNTVQQTAAALASDQARMRRQNVATTFVNLGRRNQNLLSRQLEHINSMEAQETNTETLQRLFQLDHLATRMRRNAESLLVLAGEETPRRFRQPVSMHQLLQAAGGEIEDFDRIEITSLDDAALEGGAASDISHLLAELLENASSFSPPSAPIQVHGRRRQTGYALSIVDQGIGMEEVDLAAANARLEDPAEFDRAPSAYLGHFVVGHLAKRHGIRVQLTDSPYSGVAAQIHLPLNVLVTAPGAEPQPDDTTLTDLERTQIDAIEMALLADDRAPGDEQAISLPRESQVAPTIALASAPIALGAATATGAPSSPAETTPSGFRKRRRGAEGAPLPATSSSPVQTPARRSPEEVQASLQSFRRGVEAGRAESVETGLLSHEPEAGETVEINHEDHEQLLGRGNQ